jgi:hypothetical protein
VVDLQRSCAEVVFTLTCFHTTCFGPHVAIIRLAVLGFVSTICNYGISGYNWNYNWKTIAYLNYVLCCQKENKHVQKTLYAEKVNRDKRCMQQWKNSSLCKLTLKLSQFLYQRVYIAVYILIVIQNIHF